MDIRSKTPDILTPLWQDIGQPDEHTIVFLRKYCRYPAILTKYCDDFLSVCPPFFDNFSPLRILECYPNLLIEANLMMSDKPR